MKTSPIIAELPHRPLAGLADQAGFAAHVGGAEMRSDGGSFSLFSNIFLNRGWLDRG